MQFTTTQQTILSALVLASTVAGHGQLVSPAARKPGTAFGEACGRQLLSQQSSDSYGNIQGELQVGRTQSDFKASDCNVWLCKGYQFADVPAGDIQQYTAGQVVPMKVDVRAPHTGTANVTIVNTKTNTIISPILKSWTDYASTATGVKPGDLDFSITMPDVSAQCATAGDCVIQWWWDARPIDQTYESCVDFTMGGGSGGGTPAPASASAPAPASTAPPAGGAGSTPAPASPTTLRTSTRRANPTPTAPAPVVVESPTSAPASATASPASAAALPVGATFANVLTWAQELYNSAKGGN